MLMIFSYRMYLFNNGTPYNTVFYKLKINNMVDLIEYLTVEGFLVDERGDRHKTFTLEVGWETFEIAIIDDIIFVEIAPWPEFLLRYLITLGVTKECQVSFNWCDDRLERILNEVTYEIENS